MRKLAVCALGYAGALLLARYVLPAAALPWCAAGLAAACLFALLLPKGSIARKRVLLTLLSAAVGFGWYGGYYALRVAPADALSGSVISAAARVTDFPVQGDGWASVTVRLEDAAAPRVLTAVYDYDGYLADADLRPGDQVTLELKLSSARVRSGEETDAYLSRGVLLVGYLRAAPRPAGRWALSFLYVPRAMARAVRLEAAALFPADVSAFLSGLLIGDKAALYADDALVTSLRRAGILHVAAVSGLHLSFLYGCVRLLVRSRRRAALIGIPALWLFALMAGAPPSALRAAAMLTLLIAAPFLRREADGITSLCAALLALLLVNPCAVGSAGLQLSFTAMAGIVLVSPRVYAWLSALWKAPEKGKGRLRAFVLASLSSSLGAVVFTAPVAAARFGSVSLVSPLTNLLTLWCVSLSFLGGYAAVLLGLLWTPLGAAAAFLTAWPARFVLLVCRGLSALPFAAVYTANGLVSAWLVFTYAVFLAAYLLRRGAPFRPTAPLCLSVIALCAVLTGTALRNNAEASVTALDVGQGQCLALFSRQSTVVVDCGGGGRTENPGDTAADFLESRGRTRVDALVLTHLHADHAGGAVRLLYRMEVDYLLLPEDAQDADGLLPGLLDAAARRGTRVIFVAEDREFTAGETRVRLWAPLKAGNANERGLVLLASCGDWDLLVTGDADASVEKRLAASGELPDCEALAVGHHGSASSTCAELLACIRPETALISVGYNHYGHPAPEVLARLEACGAEILRTDTDGSVTVRIGDYGEKG